MYPGNCVCVNVTVLYSKNSPFSKMLFDLVLFCFIMWLWIILHWNQFTYTHALQCYISKITYICLSVCFICLSIYPSIHPSIHRLSVYLFLHPSLHPSNSVCKLKDLTLCGCVCLCVNRSSLNLKMPWRQTRRSCRPWWRLWSYIQNNSSWRPRTMLTRVSLCTQLHLFVHSWHKQRFEFLALCICDVPLL